MCLVMANAFRPSITVTRNAIAPIALMSHPRKSVWMLTGKVFGNQCTLLVV